MNDAEFTQALVEQLRASLTNLEVEAWKSLFYSLHIDESGNIPLNVDGKGEPIRGGGTGFEQDILLFERITGQTSVVPRVSIEIKFGRVTTHDAIVYSEKAERIRNVYPYLRYGLILGDMATIPPRVLRLGLGFDFMLRISNPPIQAEMDRLLSLLSDELEISRKLGKVFSGHERVSIFRRQVRIEPDFELALLSKASNDKAASQGQLTRLENPSGISYYVYENWKAEKKAKIHYGHCSYCNYGKGIHPEAGTRNGSWLGPFVSFSDAEQAAENTGRPVSVCKVCGPH